jgi:ubiquitin C-terminal hydrolase
VPEVTGLLLYVGLHNLGCTCYMNSLLQQMFMTPGFGEAILNGMLAFCSAKCLLTL